MCRRWQEKCASFKRQWLPRRPHVSLPFSKPPSVSNDNNQTLTSVRTCVFVCVCFNPVVLRSCSSSCWCLDFKKTRKNKKTKRQVVGCRDDSLSLDQFATFWCFRASLHRRSVLPHCRLLAEKMKVYSNVGRWRQNRLTPRSFERQWTFCSFHRHEDDLMRSVPLENISMGTARYFCLDGSLKEGRKKWKWVEARHEINNRGQKRKKNMKKKYKTKYEGQSPCMACWPIFKNCLHVNCRPSSLSLMSLENTQFYSLSSLTFTLTTHTSLPPSSCCFGFSSLVLLSSFLFLFLFFFWTNLFGKHGDSAP